MPNAVADVALAIAELVARAEDEGRCPVCGSSDLMVGYGFAGGGLGGYRICLDCDEPIDKERSDLGDCFNGIAERGE